MGIVSKEQELLTKELVEASREYYGGAATMSDMEFDKKRERLEALEAESGVVLPGSPSENVGAAPAGLKKVLHEYPALSLDKVKYKDVKNLQKWLGGDDPDADEYLREGILSLKLDGLTVVATYDNGQLVQCATRGNGVEGSDITRNAMNFHGLPKRIQYKGHLVVRGEALMEFEEFNRVNALAGGIYENARNLASATIQMLDSEEAATRRINFLAHKLVFPLPTDEEDDYRFATEVERFAFLASNGFAVVPHFLVSNDNEDGDYSQAANWNLLLEIEELKEKVKSLPYPTDGLVLSYNDQMYAESLGSTGHHPRGSIALKWTDETVTTRIREIEWSVGNTGVLTPVAVFDPVRLGIGSTVTRASLHNWSIVKKLSGKVLKKVGGEDVYPLMIGAKAEVYLANMIIPQVASVTVDDATEVVIAPAFCPVCHQAIVKEGDETKGEVENFFCANPSCPAKVEGLLERAFSKDGLFVRGLGPRQIEDLRLVGLVGDSINDVFQLALPFQEPEFYHKKDLLLMTEGWGEKSWDNLVQAIDDARETDLPHFVYALGIPMVGHDLSKKLDAYCHGNVSEFMGLITLARADKDAFIASLTSMDGVGEEKAASFADWAIALTEDGVNQLGELIQQLTFRKKEESAEQTLAGKTFVITGSVHHFDNRDAFKAFVESRGGKVSGSVSKNTDFLVNNDIASTSGKNAKAKELNIPIISEDEFLEKFGQ